MRLTGRAGACWRPKRCCRSSRRLRLDRCGERPDAVPGQVLDGVVDGSIDRAFRRWSRPRVRRWQPAIGIGVIGFDSVEAVDQMDLTDEDARRAGFTSLDDLRRFVERRREGSVYRIRFASRGTPPGPARDGARRG